MPLTPLSQKAQGLLLVCSSFILIVAALALAKTILVPIVLAILLAFIFSPVVNILQRRGLGRIFSVLLVVLLAFAALGGIGLAVGAEIKKLAADLPQRSNKITEKISSLALVGKGSWLDSFYHTTDEIAEQIRVKPVESFFPILTTVAGPTIEFLASALLVVVLVVFMLIQREDLRNRVVRLLGKRSLVRTTKAFDDGMQRISRFLLMQFLINTAFGTIFGIGLFIIGVPYAVLWGFLAAALRYIPYIGSWIAASLPFLLSLALLPGWTQTLCVLGLFLVLEIFTWNVIEPCLFGQSIGVSAVALLISAAFWGWLWGPIGLVLSTPLTACLVVLGRYAPPLEFFSVLLGDEPVLDRYVIYYQRLLARDTDEAAALVEEVAESDSVETIYDKVFLPALVLAKQNLEHGELSESDKNFIREATQEIAREVVTLKQESKPAPTCEEALDSTTETDRARVLVFGCPARDEMDELALELFAHLLDPATCRFEVLSAERLTAEVIAHIEEDKPALVCIASLPPKGVAHTRYLCKRLRARFSDLKILVGCWGLDQDSERTRDRLVAAGANLVGFTMLQTRAQVGPLIQVQAHIQPAEAAASSA